MRFLKAVGTFLGVILIIIVLVVLGIIGWFLIQIAGMAVAGLAGIGLVWFIVGSIRAAMKAP